MVRRLIALSLLVAIATACAGDDDAAAPSTDPTPLTTLATVGTSSTADHEGHHPTTSEPTSAPASTTTPATTVLPPPAAEALLDCLPLTSGVNEFSLEAGGADHPVRVFVPSSYDGQRLPTVLDWHGLVSNGVEQAVLSGYEELAEADGFIVVHPTGVPAAGDTRNSWELADFQDPARDDLAFADALIQLIVADWCADPARIYSTGMSNGGYFTSRLVCHRADRIAAAVSVAGTYHLDDCTPARPVPYLSFHGTDDQVVPFNGGGQSVLATDDPASRSFFEQVMPAEFAEFAADAGCTLEPTSTAVGDDVIRYDYEGCAGGTPMTFFEVTGGGHTWPGSPIADAVAGTLGYTTNTVDATADGWAFFQQHALGD
jgi:polyhydroxybutyrate depolymerase